MSNVQTETESRKKGEDRKRWLAGMVSGLLPSVPRGVRIAPTLKGRKLEVSWQSAQSMAVCRVSTSKQRVTLHDLSTCSALAESSLYNASKSHC